MLVFTRSVTQARHAMTDKFAIFGNPVAQSKSPPIHQQFADQFGLQIDYIRMLSTDEQFVGDLKQFFFDGAAGCNVTAPFKELAFQSCDSLTDKAARARAVNTVFKQSDNTLLGHNSDGIGLVTDIVQNKQITIRDRHIMILGAGGATRGILEPIIAEQPCRITLANRTVARARSLAAEFEDLYTMQVTSTDSPEYESSPDLLINATSASLSADVPVKDTAVIAKGTVCYDLSYAAQPTSFLQWAKAHGAARSIDGKGMLVEQAANSFYVWTGHEPETSNVIRWLEKNCG